MNQSEIGCEDTVYKSVGFDAHGVRRVWAADYNSDIAETRCREDATAYVRNRPDTGPLSAWRFEFK